MLIRTWRFATLVLVALSMGASYCHVLELPAKMQWDGPLYVQVQNEPPGLYIMFGLVGGPLSGLTCSHSIGSPMTWPSRSFRVLMPNVKRGPWPAAQNGAAWARVGDGAMSVTIRTTTAETATRRDMISLQLA
jgi:hypothetical protein